MSSDHRNPDIVHRRVVFHGRVQGVGFRYTTQSLSRRFEVGGYVKNLSDGTVELVVAGEESEVDGLLKAIQSQFDANVSSVDVASLDESGIQTGDGLSIRR